MNDDLVCSLDEKHLSNMRVVDLKQELEKRGLSKSGSKKDLVKRLKQQLQFEKLCEGATSVKDNDSKLDLDEATEQNEFVQRYLAEKQKIYAEHKEAQRLIELREQQDSASSANEDVAEESDIVEINSSACEVSILSSSISTEQDVSVDDHCIPESSSIEEDSSIKDDNDVSKSVELDSSEENYHFVKEKSNLQSTEIHNKECSVSSVKVSCDRDSIKGEVKIRMKIHSTDSEHPLDINTKICENIAEELNLANASGNSRSNWDQFESNLPSSDIESAHHISMEYSLSDIQLPDAPGGKKAENKMTDKVASNDVNRSSTNGEENTTLEISDMEVDLPEKQCENLNSTKSNVCERDNQVDKKICKTDPETSVTGELLEVLSKSKNTDSGSSLEKPIEQEVSVEKSKSIEIQMSVTECEIIEDCLTKDNGQTPEISLEVPNKTIASKNEVDMQCEKANALSTDKKCTKLSISKSEKLNKEDEKNLEKIVIHDPKSSLQYSCTSEDQSKDNVGGVHGTEKSVHKRKNHRTRHSSSHSSSSDSSSSERVFRSLEEPAKANPADLAPPSPASLQSKSRSESPQSDNKSTTEAPVRKVLDISVPTEKRRLKINRNTVIKTEPNESLVKGEPMEVVLAEKSIGSVNFSGPIKCIDSTVEKDVGCSEEPMQAPESSRVIKFTRRKITIVSQKTNNATEKSCESNPSTKRRKWGNCAAALSRGSLSISSDSLKNLIPDVKPYVDIQMLLDPDDHSPPVSSEMPSPSRKEPKPFNIPLVEDSVNDVITEKISNPGVKDSSLITSEVACSPPHNPTSSILFITNLVRPFTLLQLKDLLKQTGNIIEENFWIDKIKSKCFVMYETEEQAVKTRAALHDLRWPSSNPKILSVDFATQEELDTHKNGSENPKPVQPTLPPVMERLETRKYPVSEPLKKRDREDRKKEKERHRTTATHVREWDKDKLTQDSPERVPSQQSEKDGEKNRNSEKKKEKKESKRRQEEDAPAKLLDDLFRKTKASPCIYWLPLTEEQARKREEERQARRLERERRWLQQREQEEAERKSRIKNRSGRDKENRRTPSRSRSPVGRRR